eukprot:6281710-Amphidinium_carterae.4
MEKIKWRGDLVPESRRVTRGRASFTIKAKLPPTVNNFVVKVDHEQVQVKIISKKSHARSASLPPSMSRAKQPAAVEAQSWKSALLGKFKKTSWEGPTRADVMEPTDEPSAPLAQDEAQAAEQDNADPQPTIRWWHGSRWRDQNGRWVKIDDPDNGHYSTSREAREDDQDADMEAEEESRKRSQERHDLSRARPKRRTNAPTAPALQGQLNQALAMMEVMRSVLDQHGITVPDHQAMDADSNDEDDEENDDSHLLGDGDPDLQAMYDEFRAGSLDLAAKVWHETNKGVMWFYMSVRGVHVSWALCGQCADDVTKVRVQFSLSRVWHGCAGRCMTVKHGGRTLGTPSPSNSVSVLEWAEGMTCGESHGENGTSAMSSVMSEPSVPSNVEPECALKSVCVPVAIEVSEQVCDGCDDSHDMMQAVWSWCDFCGCVYQRVMTSARCARCCCARDWRNCCNSCHSAVDMYDQQRAMSFVPLSACEYVIWDGFEVWVASTGAHFCYPLQGQEGDVQVFCSKGDYKGMWQSSTVELFGMNFARSRRRAWCCGRLVINSPLLLRCGLALFVGVCGVCDVSCHSSVDMEGLADLNACPVRVENRSELVVSCGVATAGSSELDMDELADFTPESHEAAQAKEQITAKEDSLPDFDAVEPPGEEASKTPGTEQQEAALVPPPKQEPKQEPIMVKGDDEPVSVKSDDGSVEIGRPAANVVERAANQQTTATEPDEEVSKATALLATCTLEAPGREATPPPPDSEVQSNHVAQPGGPQALVRAKIELEIGPCIRREDDLDEVTTQIVDALVSVRAEVMTIWQTLKEVHFQHVNDIWMELWYAACARPQKGSEKVEELLVEYAGATSRTKEQTKQCMDNTVAVMKKAQTDLTAPWTVVKEYTSKTKQKTRVEWDAILRTVGLPSRQQAADDYSRRHQVDDSAKVKAKRQWSEKGARTQWHSREWKQHKWHADRWHTAWREQADETGGTGAQGPQDAPAWEPYDWSEQLARHKREEDEEDAERAAQAGKSKKVGTENAGATKQSRWREIDQAPDDDQTWGEWQAAVEDSDHEEVDGCPPAPKRGWQRFGLLERMERNAKRAKLEQSAPWDSVTPAGSASRVTITLDIVPPPPPAAVPPPPPAAVPPPPPAAVCEPSAASAPWRNRHRSVPTKPKTPVPPMAVAAADGTFKRVPCPPLKTVDLLSFTFTLACAACVLLRVCPDTKVKRQEDMLRTNGLPEPVCVCDMSQ